MVSGTINKTGFYQYSDAIFFSSPTYTHTDDRHIIFAWQAHLGFIWLCPTPTPPFFPKPKPYFFFECACQATIMCLSSVCGRGEENGIWILVKSSFIYGYRYPFLFTIFRDQFFFSSYQFLDPISFPVIIFQIEIFL